MNLLRVYAITKRLVLLGLRFKWNFFFSSIVSPIKNVVSFLFLYWGFFQTGAIHIGDVDKSNYIIYLLFAMIFNAAFTRAFGECSEMFLFEKFWQTIQGLLVSPAKSFEILLGYGLVQLIGLLPVILFAMGVWCIWTTPSFFQFMLVLLLLGIMFLLLLGMGFIKAGFVLANENISSFFMPIMWVLLFLSCFYYPIESVPQIFRPLIQINPVYHAGYAITNIVLNGKVAWISVIYSFFASVVFTFVGALTVARVWKKQGIQGY